MKDSPELSPSLEWQQAFNLCATEAIRLSQTTGFFIGDPLFYRQFTHWMPEIQLFTTGGKPQTQVNFVVWTNPSIKNGQQVLKEFIRFLSPGGLLCVVTKGWLTNLLSGQRGQLVPKPSFSSSTGTIQSWLRRAGLEREALWGIFGPISLLWGALAGRALRLGRQDIADRCYFEMRERMISTGWPANLSACVLVTARKKG